MTTSQALARAWARRGTEGAVRVFHGPGEGTAALAKLAIDRFGEHAWVTVWDDVPLSRDEIADFLKARGLRSAVIQARPKEGALGDPEPLFGEPPAGRFSCREGGLVFRIQLLGVKHPGLFLDHAPLREWLRAHARGKRVLNTFAYTGSLSVACGAGGAAHVTTLDLSRPTIEWARENWAANGLSEESARFIAGDTFDWLRRFAKKAERFDGVILDPPSFSRGPGGTFSTAKDLPELHARALAVVEPGGFLATSINSASIPRARFLADVQAGAREAGLSPDRLEILTELSQPPGFPWRNESERHLKGWIFRLR